MRRNMFMILAACATLFAQAAWYWPFGSSEDDPSKPLRLHRLLEEANNYIEIAEDEALNGKADAAAVECVPLLESAGADGGEPQADAGGELSPDAQAHTAAA